jgi:Flp pilus assembly secretin CpaC
VFLPGLVIVGLAAARLAPAAGEATAWELYEEGRAAEKDGHITQAFLLYARAAALEPNNPKYWQHEQALQTRAALESRLMPPVGVGVDGLGGDETPPVAAATVRDLADARRPLPPMELSADPVTRDFDLREDAKKTYQDVAKAFGLDCVFDADYVPGPAFHFELREATYRDALHGLELATGTFLVPLSPKLFLVSKDTPQKRQTNEPSVAVAIPLPETSTPQDFNMLIQAVQQTMGIEKVSFDSTTRTVILRDRLSKILPARALFQELNHPHAQVMVEARLVEVSRNDAITYGIDFPDMFTLTPLTTWMNNLARLSPASGVAGFLSFGGGTSLVGIGIMNASLVAQLTKGSTADLLAAEVRSVDGQAASLHVGDRYPVVTSSYSSGGGAGTSTSGAPAITTQPQSQTVTIGNTATFSVAATGTAPLTYQWLEDGIAIAGATSSTYTTPATTLSSNDSTFSVDVANSISTVTSTVATLTVTSAAGSPSITAQPQNQTVTVGLTATFSVTATGNSPLYYQWSENGTTIAGANSSSYTTAAVALTDNGSTFSVTVSNTIGAATSVAATLTVSAVTGVPTITTQPQTQTASVGETATFGVSATGTSPLAYQWYENQTAIAGATSSSYTTAAVAATDNGAVFTVTVSNALGMVTSNAATLTVTAAAGSPTITTQPQTQTVAAGLTATFNVIASGTTPLTYQWYQNGTAIAGATSDSYTTPTLTSAYNGYFYTVTVSNAVGTISSGSATLTVSASTGTSGSIAGYNALATIPAFQYQDLGFLLKVTPYVHNIREISLDVDAEFQLITGQSVDGLPVISSRVLKSTVSLKLGEWAVVSGLVNPSDAHTIAGLAGLSRIPFLGALTSTHSKTKSTDDVILLLRPYLVTAPASASPTQTFRVGTETRPITPL